MAEPRTLWCCQAVGAEIAVSTQAEGKTQQLIGIPVVVRVKAILGRNDMTPRVDKEIRRQAQDSILGFFVEATGSQNPTQTAPENAWMQHSESRGFHTEPAIVLLGWVRDAVKGELRLIPEHLVLRRMKEDDFTDARRLKVLASSCETQEMEVAYGAACEAAELQVNELCGRIRHCQTFSAYGFQGRCGCCIAD